MRDHELWEERLSALLDGELSETEEAETRAHLASCPDCRALYAAFTALSDGLTPEEAPADLHARINGALDLREKVLKRQRRLRRLRPLYGIAAGLAVIVGSVLALRGGVAGRSTNASPPMTASYGAESQAETPAEAPAAIGESKLYTAYGLEEPSGSMPVPVPQWDESYDAKAAEAGDSAQSDSEFAATNGIAAGAAPGELPAATAAPELANEPEAAEEDEVVPEEAQDWRFQWPEEITHAVWDDPAMGMSYLVTDPERLSPLVDYAVTLCRTAEPSPLPAPETEPVCELWFYRNDLPVLHLTLSEDDRLRMDDGVWLQLTPEQTAELKRLLEEG